MGAIVMKQFIDRFKAMEKIANETLAANPEALVGVESLPGSEHDAKVPAEAKKDDKEVQQGQPAGATSTSGAVAGGDAKPLNEGKLEMDQPLTNAEQKPLTSDDALTAKTASSQLAGLVKDLLADLKGTQKEAGATDAGAQAGAGAAGAGAAGAGAAGAGAEAGAGEGGQKKAETMKITLDDETISKIAAASAAFIMGREAADDLLKKASAKQQTQLTSENARKLIKDACVKAAQEQGLDPNAAAAAADNAMAAAGIPAEVAAGAGADAGAEAGAAAGAAAGAEAGSGEGGAASEGAAILPDDVTEEELATAIIDCVSSGELDPDTAKALVEEIATDGGAAAPSEDDAAAIIAQGLENGEITPEQAQEIATAIENGGEGGAGAEAGAVDEGAAAAEAQGAADAAAAVQDAQDEAQGAADAEAAMKEAAAHVRKEAIAKVAAAVQAKREQVKKEAAVKEAAAQGAAAQAAGQAAAGNKIMAKVASILQAKKDAKAKSEATKQASAGDESYIAGFKKKAEELGVDPAQLAKYMLERNNAAQ